MLKKNRMKSVLTLNLSFQSFKTQCLDGLTAFNTYAQELIERRDVCGASQRPLFQPAIQKGVNPNNATCS